MTERTEIERLVQRITDVSLERERAIQRVRDVCEQWQNYDAVDRATAPYLLVTDKLTAAKQILQALDGAQDE